MLEHNLIDMDELGKNYPDLYKLFSNIKASDNSDPLLLYLSFKPGTITGAQ